MSESLVNLETGEIKWDDIKKLYYEHVEDDVQKFKCKKCQSVFTVKLILVNIRCVKNIEIIR